MGEAAEVQPGDDRLHGEIVRNDIVGPPRWLHLEREKEEMTMIPIVRRRSRAGTRVRRYCEELPLGTETAVWRPALGLRVITHGWKMKPEGWMRSPQ